MSVKRNEIVSIDSNEAKVFWTIFDDIQSKRAHEGQGRWADVVALVTNAAVYPSKAACPLFKGAKFGLKKTPTGALRNDDNLIAVSIIEGDYDVGKLSVQEAIERLEQFKVRALVVTTASHTPDKPRWRVLAPLSQSVPPSDRYRLVARLNGALGGVLASESFTASQAYFYGRVHEVPFELALTFGDPNEGHCIDDLVELDQIAIGKREFKRIDTITGEMKFTTTVDETVLAALVVDLGRQLKKGDGRRDMLKSFTASLSARNFDPIHIAAELRRMAQVYFDPKDPVDWDNIDRMVADIAAKDRARADVTSTIVAPLLKKYRDGQTMTTHSHEQSAEWVQALKYYQPPLQAWREPPPIRWAVDGLIRAATVGGLVAPGATGKTTLLITLGICHALGRPFMGRKVQQGGFLLLSLDDAQEDLDAAVGLVLRAMELSEEDIKKVGEYLRVISLQGWSGPRTFNVPGTPGQLDVQMVQALCDACNAVPQLVGVCVDTLRQFAGGPTNDEQTIMAVSSSCAMIAVKTGAYFVIPHHTGKAQAREDAGDMYAGSGSAAIADNARFLLVLGEVTERAELRRFDAQTQQDQNDGICTVLRLSSRRGSIRHKAEGDLFIARRGYLMEVAVTHKQNYNTRVLLILSTIRDLMASSDSTSKNAVYRRLGGNRERLLEQIDELIETGLVVSSSQCGSHNPPKLMGLTPAGSDLLESLISSSQSPVPY